MADAVGERIGDKQAEESIEGREGDAMDGG
jgi:hypothetical protein